MTTRRKDVFDIVLQILTFIAVLVLGVIGITIQHTMSDLERASERLTQSKEKSAFWDEVSTLLSQSEEFNNRSGMVFVGIVMRSGKLSSGGAAVTNADVVKEAKIQQACCMEYLRQIDDIRRHYYRFIRKNDDVAIALHVGMWNECKKMASDVDAWHRRITQVVSRQMLLALAIEDSSYSDVADRKGEGIATIRQKNREELKAILLDDEATRPPYVKLLEGMVGYSR